MSENGLQLGHRAEKIYLNLRRELIKGVYSTDSRLPSIEHLAKRHNVTPVTLRKAAMRLAEEGMLDIRHGSGMYVRSNDGKNPMSKTISVMYMYDGESINRIQHEILDRGFLTSVYSQIEGEWDVGAERIFLRQVKEQRHHALIAFCSPVKPGNDDLLEEIAYGGTRVIHIEHYDVELPRQNYILPDFKKAGEMAFKTLHDLGYSPIYALYQSANFRNNVPFLYLTHEGIKKASLELTRGFDAEKTHLEMPTHIGFKKKIRKVVESVPDGAGVIAFTGAYGKHLICETRRQGRSVGEGLGIISIDVADRDEAATDIMSFSRDTMILEAIEWATGSDVGRLRRLVPPLHLKKGTVRK